MANHDTIIDYHHNIISTNGKMLHVQDTYSNTQFLYTGGDIGLPNKHARSSPMPSPQPHASKTTPQTSTVYNQNIVRGRRGRGTRQHQTRQKKEKKEGRHRFRPTVVKRLCPSRCKQLLPRHVPLPTPTQTPNEEVHTPLMD